MKKIYLFLLSLICLCNGIEAQVSNYVFTQSTSTYTPVTGGTVYGNATSDDQKFVNPAVPLGDTVSTGVGIPIGFNFTFNGQTFDRIAINYNGWISFGSSLLTPSVNNQPSNEYDFFAIESPNPISPASLRNRVSALNIDLEAGSSSQLRVQTLGSGTNQVCVIQWSNVHEYSFSSESFSFQIRLSQATGAVQIIYGPNTRTTDLGSDPQVGLGGATNSDFNNRSGTTWTATTPGITNSDVIYFYSASVPPSGLTYTWTAASCIPPATVSFTTVTIPNASISWTAVAGAASYEYAVTTSSTPPASGTNTTSTSASVAGLPAATVLFAHVRTNCGSSFSAWKTKAYLPCVTNVAPAAGATGVAIPTSFDWTTIAGATTYQILVSSDNGVTYPLSAVSATHPVSLGGLFYNTTYKFYVRAIFGTDSSATTCATTNATSFTTVAPPPPPPNDNCSGAITISQASGPVNGTTVAATQSQAAEICATFTGNANDDVWYKFTTISAGSATITLTTTSSSFDAVLVGYSGTCAGLTNIGCADATGGGGTEILSFTGLAAATTYYFRVYGYGAAGTEGTFILTATGPALPVTGVVLSGLRNGSKAQLSWQTLTEINNAGFELQRSADGRSFTGIANIASKANNGNSTAAINYTIDDIKPFAGANYYRLKQTDKDGKISYSNIVYLKSAAVSTLTLSAVYPNPTRDVLKAAIQAPAAESITFIVTDMMGKTISRQVSSVVTGDNTVNINVANLPSGSYLLKAVCRNGCETTYQKFTKQ